MFKKTYPLNIVLISLAVLTAQRPLLVFGQNSAICTNIQSFASNCSGGNQVLSVSQTLLSSQGTKVNASVSVALPLNTVNVIWQRGYYWDNSSYIWQGFTLQGDLYTTCTASSTGCWLKNSASASLSINPQAALNNALYVVTFDASYQNGAWIRPACIPSGSGCWRIWPIQLDRIANVKTDFGARCDGATDDAPAIRAAIASGKSVYLPSCGNPYVLGSFSPTVFQDVTYMFTLNSNTVIQGETGTMLKVKDAALNIPTSGRTAGIFLANAKSNILVSDLALDMNGTKNLVKPGQNQAGYGFDFYDATNVTVQRVEVANTPGVNAIIFTGGLENLPGDYCVVKDSLIRNGGDSIPGNTNQVDFSAIYTDCTHAQILNNKIVHDNVPFRYSGGIELHNSHALADHNTIEESFPGMYIGYPNSESTPTITDVRVTNNTFTSVNWGITFDGPGDFDQVTISQNAFSLAEQLFTAPFFSTQWNGKGIIQHRDDTGVFAYRQMLKNSVIANNTFVDTETNAAVDKTNFLVVSALDTVSVTSNTFSHSSGEPIILEGSPYGLSNVTIGNNRINDFGQNSGLYGHHALSLDLNGSATGCLLPTLCSVSAPKYYDAMGITFQTNTITQTTASPSDYAYFFSWGPNSVVQNLTFQNNPLTNVTNIKGGPQAGNVTIN